LIFAQKKMKSLSVSEKRKNHADRRLCSLDYTADTKKIVRKSAALNFAVGFGAVLVAVQMFLAGRGLGHANGEKSHKADSRHNKAGKHAAQATMNTT
jgi:hypothetical protein